MRGSEGEGEGEREKLTPRVVRVALLLVVWVVWVLLLVEVLVEVVVLLLLVTNDAGDAGKHLGAAELGGRVVGVATHVVHGEGDLDGRVDLAVLHQVAARLVHGASIFGQVEAHGAQLDALAAACVLLEDVEHDQLLLQHGAAADVEA